MHTHPCTQLRNTRAVANIKNQPTCSRKCMSELKQTWTGKNSTRIGAVLSDETKQKISDSNTGIIKPSITGNLNPACRPEVREQISKTRIERGVAKGEKNGMYGKTHTPEAIRKIMSHRSMNKLEKIVADVSDWEKLTGTRLKPVCRMTTYARLR